MTSQRPPAGGFFNGLTGAIPQRGFVSLPTCHSRVTTESEVVARSIKAVQESTEALALFDTAAEKVS
ncbi:hypothetical protein DMR34_27355 [Klebsiella variicola]|nr:hypothetical protein DMR34_27355 [Klebsiella variicola]